MTRELGDCCCLLLALVALTLSCDGKVPPGQSTAVDRPLRLPDYTDVTLPPNTALNFQVRRPAGSIM
jgi:hypothetical protein